MKLRRTVSLTALLTFALLIASSLALYVAPNGRIARWADWRMLGLDRAQWVALHVNIGVLFLVACLVHTVLNGKCILLYLRNQKRKLRIFTSDFNAALALTALFTLLTLLHLPPVDSLQTLNTTLRERADTRYGAPPFGQAQNATLRTFCRRTGQDLAVIIEQLEQAGLQNIAAESTIANIARANHLAPQQLYDLMRAPTQSP